MIIVMDRHCTEEQIDAVTEKVTSLGLEINRSEGSDQTLLGIIGPCGGLSKEDFLLLEGVFKVVKISPPFKLAQRTSENERAVVEVDGVRIGGGEVVVMAGPCAVEDEEQINAVAACVSQAGGKFLRGGAFKLRTSPYSFQGLGEEGLKILRSAADRHGLKVVTEIISSSHIPMFERYAHLIQVGARNMLNYHLLTELGKIRTPVLLKRGMSATIEEWLLAAEYLLDGGNANVVLCERGIRSFDTRTRNVLDLSAIPVVQGLSHLPVIADPSHGTGFRKYVMPLARAAVAVGADGLLVEVHHEPHKAQSDGQQSIYPEQFSEMMVQCRKIAKTLGRQIAKGTPRE